MTVGIEKAIKKGYDWKNRHHITYNMYGSRSGKDGTFDCSSYVYSCLVAGGASKESWPVSTESEHAWLKKNGFKLISQNRDWKMKRGDIVIWGKLGQSAGAGGHTGICVSGSHWLECTAYTGGGNGPYGGIIESNHDSRWAMNGGPYFYAYRYAGKKPKKAKKAKKKDWSKQYYTSNPKKVKLLKNDGLYLKTDIDFKKGKKGGQFRKGTVFVISGIKKQSNGRPRLVTQSGYLLTANKKYVRKV